MGQGNELHWWNCTHLRINTRRDHWWYIQVISMLGERATRRQEYSSNNLLKWVLYKVLVLDDFPFHTSRFVSFTNILTFVNPVALVISFEWFPEIVLLILSFKMYSRELLNENTLIQYFLGLHWDSLYIWTFNCNSFIISEL